MIPSTKTMAAVVQPGAHQADVIVIGAGFSGLSAAIALKAAGKSVIVLEARDQVGGRVKSAKLAGVDIDVGGMWQGGGQAKLDALARKYGIRKYPTNLTGDAVVNFNGQRFRAPGENFIGVLSEAEQQEMGELAGKLEAIGQALPSESPWNAEGAKALDSQTLASWLDDNTSTPGARAVMNTIARSVFCAEPEQLSLLFFAYYLKSGSGLLLQTSAGENGAQNFAFEGGLHSIAAAMARELTDELRLSTPVQTIRYSNDAVTIETTNGIFEGRRAIVALPPTMAGRIAYDPLLPHMRDGLTQRMPMGSVIKAWIAYRSPFWRRQGYNGMIASDRPGFNLSFDMTPPGVTAGLIVGFFEASEAAAWSSRGSEARQREVVRVLVDAFGPEAAEPIGYIDNDWTAEPWTRGCYGAVAPPGVFSYYGEALRKPVGPIHWAGTESSTEWTGYIEGAINAGERAASEVIGS